MRHWGWSLIWILHACEKEIAEFPLGVREDLADAIRELAEGRKPSFPLSRPMPSIGRGVHELRFRDRSGIYRVIYVFIVPGDVFLIHGFMKKTQETSHRNIELAKKRLKEVRDEK